MENNGWKQQETIIAIANNTCGEWEFFTFPNWDEASLAVNAARKEGKIAVVYDGASPPVPPEL